MVKYTIDIGGAMPAATRDGVIDRGSPVPLYHQMKEFLRGKLEVGDWRAGDLIPPEEELAGTYGLSRGTVRKAMEDLVREGLLIRERGRGTFVAPPKFEHGLLELFSVYDSTRKAGRVPGSRIIEFIATTADEKVRRYLELPSGGEHVYRLVRVRLVDGIPLMLDRVYIPVRDCPGLLSRDLTDRSLYDLLAREYGIALGKARQIFEPVLADGYEAGLLEIAQGSPALLVRRVTLRAGGTPLVYSKITIRGDRCRFSVEIPGR